MSGTVITERRRLGRMGPEVSAIGLGCMSLSGVYGTSDEEAGIALIHRAIELGVDHFDSSDMYGWSQNEELLGRPLKGRRDGIVLASKFGQTRRPGGALAVAFLGAAARGRSLLTGAIPDFARRDAGETRGRQPRFVGDNFFKSRGLVEGLEAIAEE